MRNHGNKQENCIKTILIAVLVTIMVLIGSGNAPETKVSVAKAEGRTDNSTANTSSPASTIEPSPLPTPEPTITVETPVEEQPPSAISGTKEDWLRAAGIDPSDWDSVDYIISRESSWRPDAVNPIGACGLPQALPCSKLGDNWSDPVHALEWANTYALSRYGSWAAAEIAWRLQNWW